MVRRKIEIKEIDDKKKQNVTFTKRRQALFKITKDLCDEYEADAAVITFSKAGNLFAFGHPAVHTVLGRYFADSSSSVVENYPVSAEQERVHGGGEKRKALPPPIKLTEAEERIRDAIVYRWPQWDMVVRDLGLSELEELEAAMKKLESEVVARASELAAEGGVFQDGEMNGLDRGCGNL